MAFVAVAAGVGAIGSIAGGLLAGGAQKSAARDAAAAQAAQTAEAKRQFDLQRGDLAPYRSVGTGALYKLSNLMGVTPAGDTSAAGSDYGAYLKANPDVMAGWQALSPADKQQFPTPESYAQYHYQNYGQAEGRNLPASAAAGQDSSEFGALDKSFTLADFQKDPGYQFRMDEGAKALDSSAAARGGVLSGGALKAMARYGQDFASNEYGNAYNRFNNDQTTRFNRLSSLAGTGQQAVTAGNQASQQFVQQGQQATNNQISNINAAGNATASQYAGIGGAIQNSANNVGGYLAMKSLAGGGFNPGSLVSNNESYLNGAYGNLYKNVST